MKTILITGASGYLGSTLTRFLSSKYEIIRIVNKNKVEGAVIADITDKRVVANLAKEYKPDYVIHAAGNKDVKFCEENSKAAFLINTKASEFLASYFRGVPICFFSTDFVFDGKKGDYSETDKPNPLNVYGKTKLAAEKAFDTNVNCIIRTSGLFDINQSFIKYVLSKLSNQEKVEAFTNIIYTPTYLPYLCNSIEAIIKRELSGIFHLAGYERVSRFEFAKLIAKTYKYDENLIIRTKSSESSSLRLLDSSLDSSKIRPLLNLKWPDLKYALKDMRKKYG